MTNQPYQQPSWPQSGMAPQGSASWDYGAPQDPQPQGWRPPPKPGLFPLRPLTFGEIFSASFRMLRMNAAASFGTAFIVQIVTGLLTAVLPTIAITLGMNRLTMASQADRDDLVLPTIVWIALSFLPGALLTLMGSALVQVVVSQVVAAGALAQNVSLGEAFSRAWRRVWPAAGYVLLLSVASTIISAIVVGLALLPFFGANNSNALAITFTVVLLLILAALILFVLYWWLQTKLLFVISAIVLEGLNPFAAIRRSWQLTNKLFWRTLGISMLMIFVVGLATQVIGGVFSVVLGFSRILTPFGEASSDQQDDVSTVTVIVVMLVSVLLSVLVQALNTVIVGGSATILYADARMRKEGLNVHLQEALEAYSEGKEPEQDPWTAPDLGPMPEPQPAAYAGPPMQGPPMPPMPPMPPEVSNQPYQPYQPSQPYQPYQPHPPGQQATPVQPPAAPANPYAAPPQDQNPAPPLPGSEADRPWNPN